MVSLLVRSRRLPVGDPSQIILDVFSQLLPSHSRRRQLAIEHRCLTENWNWGQFRREVDEDEAADEEAPADAFFVPTD